eukprot:g10156.t1
MALTGRGTSPTETLSLRALQAGVAAAVESSGLSPPVIVAHSMAGFVCQQYLQSYSASGLVLLDSFPPTPSGLAVEHLHLAYALAGDIDLNHRDPDVLAETRPGLSSHELAQLMNDNPALWEGLLRTYFEDFHRDSPFTAKSTSNRSLAFDGDVEGDGSQSELSPSPDVDVVDRCGVGVGSAAGWVPSFPVKAFAQMCLGQPSSTLRLESHVVETLVLGSGGSVGVGNADDGVPSGARDSSSFGGDDLGALNSARRHALEAICEFHGAQGWSSVNRRGLAGSEKAGSLVPWQEAVWDWYDARF